LRDYIPNRLSRDEALAALRKVPREVCEKAVMFGSPDQIVNKLEAYAEAGLQHVVLWNATFFCDINKLSSSFHCMDEILKHFKSKEQQPTTISKADARSSAGRQQA
jgi:phthiodiolone/phenolphthiodiolone dimycocerosates ketoreductase